MTPLTPYTLAQVSDAFSPTLDGSFAWKDHRGDLFAVHRRGPEVAAVEIDFPHGREVFTLREPSGEFHLRDCAPLGVATRLDLAP